MINQELLRTTALTIEMKNMRKKINKRKKLLPNKNVRLELQLI